MNLNVSDLSRRIVATEDLQGLSDHERLGRPSKRCTVLLHCASLPSKQSVLLGRSEALSGKK